MAEGSQNKSLIINDFSPGWVLKRGTAASPNAPILLTNAYVDEDGSIIARNGITRINSQPLTDGSANANAKVVHSHFLSGGVRYIGVGGIVKRGFDPGITIITGLSGSRITVAQMSPSTGTAEQWTYFANGEVNCRKKDNGAITRNWGIDGPSSAPTVALLSSQPAKTSIDSFGSAYTAVDGLGTEGSATDPYDTSARAFTVPFTKTERYKRSVTVNLSAYDESAYIRIMMRVSRVEFLDHVEVAFGLSDSTFVKDFYQANIPASEFVADNTWQEIRVRKQDFRRETPTGSSTKTWADVTDVQFTVASIDTQTTGNLVVSVDDMRIEEDTHADGVFEYKMTWWSNGTKIRSNARSIADLYSITERISSPIQAQRQGIRVTRTASASDPQVTHWELWRRNRKGAGVFQFVDRIAVATSTYDDFLNDIQLGEQFVEDDDTIPPPAKFVVHWDDRLFLLGMASDNALGTGDEQSAYTIRYSKRFYPESFPINNYLLAGDPKDTIRGFAIWQAQLWVWTKKHIYRVVAAGDSYIVQLTESPVGTESPYSISPSPYGIFYYASKSGPYVFNGSTSTPIATDTIQPFFEGEVVSTDGINIPVATPVFINEHTNVVAQYHDRFYTLIVDDSSGTCRTIVFNAQRHRWHRLEGKDLTIQRITSEKTSDDFVTANNLEAGNADGWLLLLSPVIYTPMDPNNEPIEVTVQHTFDVIAKPQDAEIDLKDIVVDLNAGGQVCLVQASFDDDPVEIIDAKATAGRTKLFFPVSGLSGEQSEGRICYKVSVRVTVQQKTFRTQIFGIGIDYWPEPRRSNAYSAMWFAPKQAGWARRGRFVLRSYAQVRMLLVFDENIRYETILPNTQGLRLGEFPTVPTGMRGKVARIVFDSDEPFVLYPQSYFEMGIFGGPAQTIAWQMQP